MSKITKLPKLAKSAHRILVISWIMWLSYRLIIHPIIMMTFGVPTGSIWLWQLFIMMPTLLLTPIVLRGRSAYGLIVTSLIVLIYWGVAGMMVFVRWYEDAPIMIWMGVLMEAILLSVICLYLIKLLKHLPPMHLANHSM